MFEQLTRENIGQYVVAEIGRPRGAGRVLVVEVDGQRAIFKDIRGAKALSARMFGRRLMAREFAVYGALKGVAGIPRAYRMLDAEAFLMEYVENVRLHKRETRRGKTVPPELYERCMMLVQAMHERGVVHFDLRNRKNFLFDASGGVYIVDFASAVRVPAWLPFRRGVLHALGAFDRAGVLKMKEMLSPEQVTGAERVFLRRFGLIRGIMFPPGVVIRLLRQRRRAKEEALKDTAS